MPEVDWSFISEQKYREIVERALNHVKKLKAEGKTWEDFELHEIKATWWDVRELVYKYNIFEISYKSRSHTFYKFAVPIEEVEKRLSEYQLVKEPVVSGQGGQVDKIEISPNFWSTIEGYDDIKEIFIASIKAREPVHILLVGPPGTAKSLMLMEVERLPGAVFVTGGTTTKVGLRDILLDKKPRFIIIDELDKISSSDDISVLLTLMESGRVIVAKHKEHREERMKTWVFAAANSTRHMPPELLDRFQKFYLRPYDDETLKRVIVKALTTYEKTDKNLAEYIAEKIVLMNGTVRDAIRVARLATTKEEVDNYVAIIKRYSQRVW
jgi:Holliday junction DNA helicase RuvB